MNPLDEILAQHFFPKRRAEIKAVLHEYGLDRTLLRAYKKLKGLEPGGVGTQLVENTNFATTIASTLHEVNQGLVPIEDESRKAEVKQIASEVTIRLWLQLIRELEIELAEIAPAFDEIIQAACTIHGYDYSDFQEHFNFNEVVEVSQDLSWTALANRQQKTKKNTLAWQLGPQALIEFVYQIKKKRRWARKPGRFFKLFENPSDSLSIYWNAEYLEELAYLIFKLSQDEIIGCLGNRGSFSAVQKHLFDFDNNKIPKERLKTLSHRINKNWGKFKYRLEAVDAVIQEVKKKARN